MKKVLLLILYIILPLCMEAQKYVVVNGVNVRLRFEPNLQCDWLKDASGKPIYAPKGTKLPYKGERGDFYYVYYKNNYLYISKQFSYIDGETSGYSGSILSVNDLLNIRKSLRTQTNTWMQILEGRGYTNYYEHSENRHIYYKDCYLYIANRTAKGIEIEAEPQDNKASFIEMSIAGGTLYVDLIAYGKANAQKWFNQLSALGYRSNGQGGQGNQGQDWSYSKSGYPDISIWNDYGDYYSMSILIR